MRTFLSRLAATLVRAPILALAFAVRALRIRAASTRLVRSVFARLRFLSRLSATLLRAAILALAVAVRALRTRAASTRLLRSVLARLIFLSRLTVTFLRAPILSLAVTVRGLRTRAAETPRDVLVVLAWLTTWPPPFADTVCALAAPFAFFADLCAVLLFGAPHAVSASARLPMHVKNTIRFMMFHLFVLI
jgi:hypothetical protein